MPRTRRPPCLRRATGELRWAARRKLKDFNTAFKGLFLKFAFRYISESHDIKTINVLSQEVEADANRNGLPASVEEFSELGD